MEPSKLHDLIDQTGIETIFGATPAQLPKLSEAAQQTLARRGCRRYSARAFLA